jgi:hypothetical protein
MKGFHYLRKAMGLPRMMEISPPGAFISLAAEGAVDRGALIRRIFADLINAGPGVDDAADVLTALALTPAEHAEMADDRVQLVERMLKHARSNFMGRETGQTIVLLRALAPTAAENARFTREHLAMLQVLWYSPSSAAVIGYAQEALLGVDRAGLLDAEPFTEVIEPVLNRPELSISDYRLAGFISRLSAGRAIDRGALIQRLFADLASTAPSPQFAADALADLALTPAEHAGALDGLVRHARGDRAGLAKALRPATRRKPAEDHDCRQADIYDVAMAVRDEKPREFAFHASESRSRYFSRAGAMLAARLSEAIDIIESGAQPFLLAVPTLATGALDADVLVGRLSKLEELGVEPAPFDLAQALLRVAPASDPQTLTSAGELHSEAGQRLARWLRDGGLPHQDSEPKDWYRSQSPGSLEPARPGTALDPSFPPVAAALLGPDGWEGILIGPPAP